MTPRRSCLLVIDASVMHSAGLTENPTSKACREALQAILEICHRVALTPEMRDEWKRHMSKYSRKWRCSMVARKKARQTIVDQSIQMDIDGLPETDQRTIERDRCLLEAALSADRVIVTLDQALRRALVKTDSGRRLADSITWINPVTDGISPLHNL